MWIINNRKIFYAITIVLTVASIASLAMWGLKPGLDFTGGALIEVAYPEGRPDQAEVMSRLATIDPMASIRPSVTAEGEEYIVRMKEVMAENKAEVLAALSLDGSVAMIEKNFSSIGPVLGSEAIRSSLWAIALVIVGIVLFITFAFRKVSEPVSSWKYGLIAIIGLVHDILIPVGVFAYLGHTAGYEVDTLFVTALLVVLGFSVHDTIVVFDRVRENLRHSKSSASFESLVGSSVNQTLVRSINTSATTLFALIALYIFGGASTEHFSLVLIIGIAAGTFSSIFVCSPLLVTIEKWGRKR